ncbi:MAG: DUF6377 domain-containing protein [Tannerellaceae bacterium]|jgi:uncharacterized protein (UPF0297 family)|nr:DUF6377 domain-containing protein [Tannerellaceae bacterium]
MKMTRKEDIWRLTTTYRTALLTTAISLFSVLAALANRNNKYEHYFLPLDTAISKQEEYRTILELQIQDLRLQRSRVEDINELYLMNKLLYAKYATYICDSALYYLGENEKLALEAKNDEWLNETCLDKCNIYIQTGMLSAASAEFQKINIDRMLPAHKALYYSLKIYLLLQESELLGTSNQQKVLEYGAELAKYASIDNESYIWALLWSYQGDDRNARLIEYLEKTYEKNIQSNNPRAGNNALVLSRIYGYQDNEEQRIKYLCLGALFDVKHVNRDPSALLELVSYLSQAGDSPRAYIYMDYVIKGQSFYPDRVRAVQMVQHMKRIFEETQIISEKERRAVSVYLLWLSVVVVLLIIFFVILVFSFRKLYRQKKNIFDINARLNENVSELSRTQNELILSNCKMQKITEEVLETNKKLKEANYIKEEYIGYIFSACSNYINKLDEFRQSINRKIKVGKVEEVLRATQPENSFMHNEVKELNQTFDSTFLSIYPDFVEDFNTLLRKEERIIIQGNKELNTELRIYALIWLGVNSSSKIANLLHVSPQTIYNVRMKIRKQALADNGMFVDEVRALGREKLGF